MRLRIDDDQERRLPGHDVFVLHEETPEWEKRVCIHDGYALDVAALNIGAVARAIKLVQAQTSPTEAARQLGRGRSTVYREMQRLANLTG